VHAGVVVEIRPANVDDLHLLPAIERAAGELFRPLGMDAVADDAPPTMTSLRTYQQAGRAFVADDDGRVVAYLLLEVIAEAAHIEQVTVHPDAAHRRIGRSLIETAEVWAVDHGLASLTLTTYLHVPWNAPYYTRLGFTIVPDGEQPRELQTLRRSERERGLDAWPRVAMHRPVASSPAHRDGRGSNAPS
jgi:N-acetylglutamate synthase-like GNAT family acetyltransferase